MLYKKIECWNCKGTGKMGFTCKCEVCSQLNEPCSICHGTGERFIPVSCETCKYKPECWIVEAIKYYIKHEISKAFSQCLACENWQSKEG